MTMRHGVVYVSTGGAPVGRVQQVGGDNASIMYLQDQQPLWKMYYAVLYHCGVRARLAMA